MNRREFLKLGLTLAKWNVESHLEFIFDAEIKRRGLTEKIYVENARMLLEV